MDNGSLKPFPSAYTFGLNTQESAYGVRVVPYAYGARAFIGPTDYSADIIVSNASEVYVQYIANTSKYTAPPTTVAPQTSGILTPGGSLPSEIQHLLPYVLFAAIGIAALVLIGMVLGRIFGR